MRQNILVPSGQCRTTNQTRVNQTKTHCLPGIASSRNTSYECYCIIHFYHLSFLCLYLYIQGGPKKTHTILLSISLLSISLLNIARFS